MTKLSISGNLMTWQFLTILPQSTMCAFKMEQEFGVKPGSW
ncbi:hypothetical protein FHR96_000453 [Halomonas organivorans]|uniref:Uncharacterized protein n=1 Tax=Halomonas organivorans TaxID=257772 RepID=A0A7W5G458_9GAMM|nr:hypothetical protein [Halomonas organivorans]